VNNTKVGLYPIWYRTVFQLSRSIWQIRACRGYGYPWYIHGYILVWISGVSRHGALELNARKFVVCSVERQIVQKIDIEQVVDRFDSLAHRLALT